MPYCFWWKSDIQDGRWLPCLTAFSSNARLWNPIWIWAVPLNIAAGDVGRRVALLCLLSQDQLDTVKISSDKQEVTIHVAMEMPFDIRKISSPSHKIRIKASQYHTLLFICNSYKTTIMLLPVCIVRLNFFPSTRKGLLLFPRKQQQKEWLKWAKINSSMQSSNCWSVWQKSMSLECGWNRIRMIQIIRYWFNN